MLRRIAALAVLAMILAPVLSIAADFPLSDKNTTVKFVGTKPNGKHEGGFKTVSGTATVKDNDPATLKISLDIDTASLYADDDKLATHLKSPDFFDVKTNPKAKFVSTKVEKSDGGYKITGDFTMLGKTKSISFPAKVAVAADGLTLSTTFSIDRTQWGMKFLCGQDRQRRQVDGERESGEVDSFPSISPHLAEKFWGVQAVSYQPSAISRQLSAK